MSTALHASPGPRVTHALLEAARGIRDGLSRETLALLVEACLPDVAAMQVYIDQQERNLHDMCAESLESAREITRLRTALAAATEQAERRLADESSALSAATARFNARREELDTLRRATVADHEIRLHTDTPRVAAGAGR